MKAKWLDRRIAIQGPYLSLCTSEKEYLAALKDIGANPIGEWIKNEHSHATAHYMPAPDGHQAVIVCIRVDKDRNPIEVAGLLVHEAVHVWQQYCQHIGEDNPGAEQEAYGIQSISQELMDEYARRVNQ